MMIIFILKAKNIHIMIVFYLKNSKFVRSWLMSRNQCKALITKAFKNMPPLAPIRMIYSNTAYQQSNSFAEDWRPHIKTYPDNVFSKSHNKLMLCGLTFSGNVTSQSVSDP